MSWTWQGRQLVKAEKDKKLSFTYDSEGIRTSKTVGSTTTKYLLNGTQILAQTTNGKTLSFFYDQQGNRVGMADSSNHFYYYIYNVQGDVIALADASTGKLAVTYTYDAWGKLVKLEDSTANSVGTQNPFRYRGYYYDTETSLYYLNSRYYDPDTGRFISADGFISTDVSGVLSTNMFAYCENNPVIRVDVLGCCWYGSDGKWHHDNWEYLYGYERKPEPAKNIGTTSSGKNVYVGSDGDYAASSNSVKVVDSRKQADPNIKIIESFRVNERTEMIEISSMLLAYNDENPSIPSWNRTLNSMVIEWDIHNKVYDMGYARDSTADVDLNNNDEGKGWLDFIWERGIKPQLAF